MVERLARAAYEADPYFSSELGNRFATWDEAWWVRPSMTKRVRAVIEALMTPTGEMVRASFPILRTFHPDRDSSGILAVEVYQAMLRTALSQPNEEGEGK